MDSPPIPTEAPKAPNPSWVQIDHIFQYCDFLLKNLPTHRAPYTIVKLHNLANIFDRLHTVMKAVWNDLYFMHLDHVLANHLEEFFRLDPRGYITNLQLLLTTKEKDKSESNNEGKGKGEGNTEDKCDNDNEAKDEGSNEGNGEENDEGNDEGNGASSNDRQRDSDGEGNGDGDKPSLVATVQPAVLNTTHAKLTTTLAAATAVFLPANDDSARQTLYADLRVTCQWSQRETLEDELAYIKQRLHDNKDEPDRASPASPGQRLGQILRELAALPKVESLLAGASPERRATLARTRMAERPRAVTCTCSPSYVKW